MTKINLISGYLSVRVKEKYIPKMIFNILYIKFEFIAISYILTNTLAMFQSIINNILQTYLDKFIIVYLHYIVINLYKKKYIWNMAKKSSRHYPIINHTQNCWSVLSVSRILNSGWKVSMLSKKGTPVSGEYFYTRRAPLYPVSIPERWPSW